LKKIIAIVVVLVSLMAGAFAYWINQPSLQGEEQITESVSSAKNRFAQSQREAKNPDLNGFLSEELLPLWAPGAAKAPVSPVQQIVSTWAAFSNGTRGNQVDHTSLLQAKDESYLAARNAFETILPDLVLNLNKRLFVVPRSALSSFETPDSGGLRMLGQAVYAFVESKVADGKPAEAIAPLASLFSLGGKMQGRGTLVNDLQGISLQRTAFETLALIPSDSDLTTEDWLKLGTAVAQGIPPTDQMARAFEAEVSVGLEHIQKNETAAAESGSYLDRLFLQREKRIFMNQTALQLAALKSDNFANYEDPESSGGTIALIRTSDFVRASHLMEFHRRSMVLTATALDLRAYRTKLGKLPETLDKLADMGLEAPKDAVEYTAELGTISIKIPPETLEGLDRKDFNLPGWSEITEDSLKLTL
jgi:hypothetical protein